eukprot:1115156-Prymnesium_polylepis.1
MHGALSSRASSRPLRAHQPPAPSTRTECRTRAAQVVANARAVLLAMGEPLEASGVLGNISNVASREDFSNLTGARDVAAKKKAAEKTAAKKAEAEKAAAEAEREQCKRAAAEERARKRAEEAAAAEAEAAAAEAAAAAAAAARDRRAAAYSQRVKRARDANVERLREECGARVAPKYPTPSKRQRCG